MESKRLQTARQFLSHTENRDATILEPILVDDYKHEVAPASVGLGPWDKKAFTGQVTSIKGILKSYPNTIIDIVESESSNSVVAHIRAEATFHDHVKDDSVPADEWKYTGEYIFWFYFNEAGDQIVRACEFLDSKATIDKLMVLIQKASAKLASESK
jgi:hypothetical protein